MCLQHGKHTLNNATVARLVDKRPSQHLDLDPNELDFIF